MGFYKILIFIAFCKESRCDAQNGSLPHRLLRCFGLSFDETKMQRLENVNVTTAHIRDKIMAMTLMLCMFVLFLGFSGLGVYMMFKTSFMARIDERDDMPPDV